MNFARDVLAAAPAERIALIERTRDGRRREWTFSEIDQASARLAGELQRQGVRKGDVVLVWLGNRAEWALTLTACVRIGAVPASCPEQLRAKDLRLRMAAARPALVVADRRNAEELGRAAPECPVAWVPDEDLWRQGEPAVAVELEPEDPCLITFTSGTTGDPKAAVHVQRYLPGQALQAQHWLGVRPGDVVWCTAAAGWSKSARNSFVAPWLRGATAVLHDGRFDPEERLAIIAEERVNVLCMAPTEYRMIAKRSAIPALPRLRTAVAAGEALDPAPIEAWREATGITVRDGYGQTETGHLAGFGPGDEVRPGSMGRPLPGIRAWIEDGELVVDPCTVPTFFRGYLGAADVDRARPWRTGDLVEQDEEGYLWFRGRADDVIISSGYRIGPAEIEASLTSHPAVAEAAVVGAPDEERGAIVRAVVVLRAGYGPSDGLVRELQEHVKADTAPYKYPRRIDFAPQLPKTASGKIKRAELRATGP